MANQPKMTEWAVLSQFWKNPIFGDFRGLVRPQTVEISGFQCQIRVQRSFLPRYGNFEPKVWSRLRFSRPLKSAIFGFQGRYPGKIGQILMVDPGPHEWSGMTQIGEIWVKTTQELVWDTFRHDLGIFWAKYFFRFFGVFGGPDPTIGLEAQKKFFWQNFFFVNLTMYPGSKFDIRALWVKKRVKTTFRIAKKVRFSLLDFGLF